MAAGRHYSAHQKGIIKRYYKHKDTLMRQRLSDLVSELYLCRGTRAEDGLWKRAERALLGAGAEPGLVKAIVGERSVEGLAEAAADLF